MEIFATMFAGLGLFFIGVKGIGDNLKSMSGRRFRSWMARATRHPALAAVIGTTFGAVTQSTSAVTFIVVSVVSAGLVQVRQALPIVAWANVGTSALVLLATLDIHLMVLYLLGVVGIFYYLDLNKNDRFRHLVGALLGVGLLFLGLWLIKSGAAPLKEIPWVQVFLSFSAGSFLLAFVVGAVLTLVAQSSATVTVVAVTMTAAGMLTLDQTLMIVMGAGMGSGLSVYFMSSNLTGTGRRLALIQVWLKFLGVILLLPLFLLEVYAGVPGPKALSGWLGDDLPRQVAWVYLVLQLLSACTASLFGTRLYRMAERCSPENPAERLARTKYIYDQSLEEAESALDLVEKEQARLLLRLPQFLDKLRPDELDCGEHTTEVLYQAGNAVADECGIFLADLIGRSQSRETMERTINIQQRHDLLRHLQDGCLELTRILDGPLSETAAQRLRTQLVEGLHAVLMVFNETLQDVAPDELEMLLIISDDRSSLMERIRAGLTGKDQAISSDTQARLFQATSLFERLIWLVHRYALLLQRHYRLVADTVPAE